MWRLALYFLVALNLSAAGWAQDVYRLGIQMHADAGPGLVVDGVSANGPATRLRRDDNPNVVGALDPGDRIVAVDGTPVRTLGEYEQAMERARENQGRVRISIVDVRSGATVDWNVTAQLVRIAERPVLDNAQFRLGIDGVETNEGIRIAGFVEQSPMLKLFDNQGQPAQADVGDVVTAINGTRVKNLNQLRAELARLAGDGSVRVTLRDIRTGREMTWNTKAIRVGPSGPQTLTGQRKIHILLCGLTNDGSIGDAITSSLAKLRKIFTDNIDKEFKGRFNVLTGAQCNANTILQTVDKIAAGPDDAVFVYYLGHGAYDVGLSQSDPSGGHFFQIPSGDLPRKELYARIALKGARLSVLITDTCNVSAVARPRLRLETRTRSIVTSDFTALERLLLFHRGQVDISASSRDQYSWFTAGYGGWFSNSLCGSINGQSDWRGLLDSVSKSANDYFHQRKATILASPGDTSPDTLRNLQAQRDMLPQAFRMQVTADPYNVPAPPQRVLEAINEVEVVVN